MIRYINMKIKVPISNISDGEEIKYSVVWLEFAFKKSVKENEDGR